MAYPLALIINNYFVFIKEWFLIFFFPVNKQDTLVEFFFHEQLLLIIL